MHNIPEGGCITAAAAAAHSPGWAASDKTPGSAAGSGAANSALARFGSNSGGRALSSAVSGSAAPLLRLPAATSLCPRRLAAPRRLAVPRPAAPPRRRCGCQRRALGPPISGSDERQRMLVALAASSAPPAPLLARPAVELLSLYVRLPNLFSQLSRNGWPALCARHFGGLRLRCGARKSESPAGDKRRAVHLA